VLIVDLFPMTGKAVDDTKVWFIPFLVIAAIGIPLLYWYLN
jgi:hypothetical protein